MTRTSVWFALFVLGLNGCGPPPGPTPSSGSAHQEAAQSAGGDAEEGHTEEIVLTADAEKIAGIKVEKVRLMPLEASLSVPGTIANTPQGKAVVTSPVAGRVTALFVKVGDTVRAGQAVATVRSVDAATAASVVIEAQRDVAVAQAGVREAKAQVDLAVAKSQAARLTFNR